MTFMNLFRWLINLFNRILIAYICTSNFPIALHFYLIHSYFTQFLPLITEQPINWEN
jgi:hypothetical protein